MLENVLFVLIMMFSVFLQSLVGFGGTLLAMPLGIMISGIALTKPVLTFVAWVTGITVVISEFRYINKRELVKMVSVMLVGVIAGIWLTGKVDLKILLLAYAVVVTAIGAKKLFFSSSGQAPAYLRAVSLAVAGIMQGLFVSGGSFLAVYATYQIPEKRAFRATVNSVWAVVNTVMMTMYAINGDITGSVAVMSGVCLIPALIAVWLGGMLTKKVRQSTFLIIVYLLLIVSGIVLFITNI